MISSSNAPRINNLFRTALRSVGPVAPIPTNKGTPVVRSGPPAPGARPPEHIGVPWAATSGRSEARPFSVSRARMGRAPGARSMAARAHSGIGPTIPRTPLEPLSQRPVGHDPVTIERAALRGKALLLDVRYGGGFEQHDFALVRNPSLVPGESVLQLSHNARGDAAEMFIGARLGFDLSSLGENPLTVRLVGWEPALRYEGVPAQTGVGEGASRSAQPVLIGEPPVEARAWVGARNVRVAGDELMLTASYSSLPGTRSELTLSWDGAFGESAPVTADLRLSRTQSGEPMALAFLPAELPARFDLAPLKEAYAGAYGAAQGAEITLRIHARSDSAPQSVRYPLTLSERE